MDTVSYNPLFREPHPKNAPHQRVDCHQKPHFVPCALSIYSPHTPDHTRLLSQRVSLHTNKPTNSQQVLSNFFSCNRRLSGGFQKKSIVEKSTHENHPYPTSISNPSSKKDLLPTSPSHSSSEKKALDANLLMHLAKASSKPFQNLQEKQGEHKEKPLKQKKLSLTPSSTSDAAVATENASRPRRPVREKSQLARDWLMAFYIGEGEESLPNPSHDSVATKRKKLNTSK